MKNTILLKEKNVKEMREVLNSNAIYNGSLSDEKLIINFEHYISIGRIKIE
jgi:hypothetical protein